MRKIFCVLLSLVTFIFFINFSPNTGYACSCAEPGSAQEELERSSAVFSGEVIGILDKNKNSYIQSSADPIAILFEVEETWKGVTQSQVVVYTERDEASCGYQFAINTKYLVFAYESGGSFKTSYCSKTTPLTLAIDDMDELGEGEVPTEQVSIELTKDESQITSLIKQNLIYILSFIILLILVVVVIVTRRKKV